MPCPHSVKRLFFTDLCFVEASSQTPFQCYSKPRGGRPSWRFEGSSIFGVASGRLKRGATDRGIRICLPVHCISAWPDRHPYCRTHATSHLSQDDQISARARESLASSVSVHRVAAAWYCHPGRHANVVSPCLLAYPLVKPAR